ncbi:MAG: ricin-type beta-trefoil lectin domain protein, partial [Actinomycetia bacterium]|nr:ricin-type beta-trefoil lectin domain protein [Actinomycetes bacterium]
MIGLGDKCLDVRLANPADGTEIFIYECHGDENQRWSFVPTGAFFELRGLAGKCAQPDGTITPLGHTRLVIGPCGGPEDRWQPSIGFPEEFTLTQASTGHCMDVEDNNTANRTPVILFPCHGGANQIWRLVGDGSGEVDEVEPNDTLATAQYLSGGDFTLDFDPDVGSTAANTSVGIPHVTVVGSGDESYDYYSF